MGNIQSIPPAHLRMYQNLLQIRDSKTRVQMISTVLASPEHQISARNAGIYGNLLHYVQLVNSNQAVPLLPGERSGPFMGERSVPERSGERNTASYGSGEQRGPERSVLEQQTQIVTHGSAPKVQRINEKKNEKAMNYFSACLRMLELEEEVALTPEMLKAAYKKAVIKAHPDKGGSEEEFEAVTKAYAYLGDILRRINGGRSTEGKVDAPTSLNQMREQESDKWKHAEPVRINPNKMDMNAFNKLFEETRMPDPEDTGYGDWLKGGDGPEAGASGPKFSGKFNREVFEQAFRDEVMSKRGQPNAPSALMVRELNLAARYGTEIGRAGTDDYTITAAEVGAVGGRAQGPIYTDLKKAYTEYNVFSHETAGVQISDRSFEQMRGERKAAPKPLADDEMRAIQQGEQQMKKAEEERRLRMAQQAIAEDSFHQRMKRMMIVDKTPQQQNSSSNMIEWQR